jgi:two-component system, chemotaxis family, chemotaxis protein CheY
MALTIVPETTNFLLLDDFEIIREVACRELRAVGMVGTLEEVSNGEDGWKILEKNYGGPNQIQFIISDLMMPKMNGHEFLAKVRSDHRFAHLPFLLLTTENEKSLVIKSIKLGVSNFLIKPYSPEDFRKKLDQCWEKAHATGR